MGLIFVGKSLRVTVASAVHAKAQLDRRPSRRRMLAVSNAVLPLEKRMLFAAFTPGDLVVYQVGSGAAALSSASQAVFLDEYSPTGFLVQQIPLPTAPGTGNLLYPLTSGNSVTEGGMTLTTDGHDLLIPGYDAAPGVTGISSTTATADPREVGYVDSTGTVNTTTLLSGELSGTNIRSVVGTDTGHLWFSGSSNVSYGVPSSSTDAQLFSFSSRTLEIYGGQLYLSAGSSSANSIYGVAPLGSGLPTTGTQTLSASNRVAYGSSAQAYQYYFTTLNPNSDGNGYDTLYVADNSAGIIKFTRSSGSTTWTPSSVSGNIYAGTDKAYVGITGTTSGSSVTLYATSSNGSLVSYTDNSGYGNAMTGKPTVLTTLATPANESFRGIAFVPQPSGVSVYSNPSATTAIVGNNATFTALPTGANVSVQWQVSTGSSFTNISTTDPAYIGATSNYLTVVNTSLAENGYQYRAVFTDATGATTVTTTAATLTVKLVPAFTFDAPAYSVSETGGTETITVDRSGDLTDASTVNFTINSGTALPGSNYFTPITVTGTGSTATGYSGTLSFPGDGTTTQEMITIPILAQSPQGGNKAFTVTLTGGSSGAVIGSTPTTTVTVVDAGETFSFSNPTYTVNDSDGQAQISVTRFGNLADSPTISYNTSDGTALAANGDYGSASGTLSFATNQSTAVIDVTVGTITAGATKTFSVHIGGPYTGSGLPVYNSSASSATVSIVDTSTYTNNFNGSAGSAIGIETAGPFSSNFADIVGDTTSTVSSFLAYELLTFSPSTSPGLYPAVGSTVNANSISNLTLQLNDQGGKYLGIPGNFDVYFVPDYATNQSSPALTYSSTSPSGFVASQYNTSNFPVSTLLGTISFTPKTGFNSFVLGSSSAGIGASVETTLVNDLNSGTSFRLAVTPATTGVGAVATGFYGINAPYTPILSISATTTDTRTRETFNISAPSFSVTHTPGTASITITRSYTNGTDAASVNITTTDGTAAAGTNYTGVTNGVVNFSAGSLTATYNIPIAALTTGSGNKVFTVTISNPTTNDNVAGGTVGVLGSQSSAIVTIVDSSPAPIETISGYSPDAATFEIKDPSGPGDVYAGGFQVEGSTSNAGYSGYAVGDFNNATPGPNGPDYIRPTGDVTAINSITLTVYNLGGGGTGALNIYLVPDATSAIKTYNSPHFYDPTFAPEGVDTRTPTSTYNNSFGTPMLLGAVNWSALTPQGFVNIPLINFSSATSSILAADLNSGTQFRIVAAAENPAVWANWANSTASSNGQYELPQLSFNVQEALPTWLAANSQAFFKSETGVLTVNGPSAIVADPGAASPIINANGSAATLAVNTSAGTAVHVGSINLTNGAAFTISPTTTGKPVAVIDAGALTIDSNSTMNLSNNFLSVTAGNLGSVTALVNQGYNNGLWAGNGGIIGPTGPLAGLGVITNQAPDGTTLYPILDGATLGTSDVLVHATYYGDANLSGKVDGSDYSLVDATYVSEGFNSVGMPSNPISGWFNGDFNFDGVVNGSDYTLLDNAYNQQGMPSSAPAAQLAVATPALAVAGQPPVDTFFSDKKVKASSLISDVEDLITN